MAFTKTEPVKVPDSAKDNTPQDKAEEKRIVSSKMKMADTPKTKAMLQQKMKDVKAGKQTPPVKVPEGETGSHQDTKEQIRVVLAKLRQNPDAETKKELTNRLKELSGHHKKGENLNENEVMVEFIAAIKKALGLDKAEAHLKKGGAKGETESETIERMRGAAASGFGRAAKRLQKVQESEDVTAVDHVKDYVANVSTQGAHAAAISTGLGALELRKILAARNNS